MNQNEIIQYLKDNRKNGVAYNFMPDEVRTWLSNQRIKFRSIRLLKYTTVEDGYYDNLFDWKECYYPIENRFDRDDIIALPEDYRITVDEMKGEWVEFEIDENGCYRILDTDMRFHWSEWNKPLWIYEKDENRSWYLTTVGGWQYKDDKRWYLAPAVKLQDGDLWNSYVIEESGEAKPAIPIKIRFWRESK